MVIFCFFFCRIRAHRIILYHANLFMAELLDKHAARDATIIVENCAGDTLRAVVRFCYLGTIGIPYENVFDLLSLVDKMKFYEMKQLCENRLLAKLSPKNCLFLHDLGKVYDMEHLSTEAFNLALSAFQLVVRGQGFLELSSRDLETLLAHDKLAVFDEEEAFEALAKWIQHADADRRIHFDELIKIIRLQYLDANVSFALYAALQYLLDIVHLFVVVSIFTALC